MGRTLAGPSPESVEALAGCMTDGPVTAEHRALARAQLLARARTVRHADPAEPPDRATALVLLQAARAELQRPARRLGALGAAVGPAFAARIAAITGQLETAGFDLATLLLDIEQGNYPRSLGEAPIEP